MLILLLPVRNQSMTRTSLYLIPGCTCASVQGSHFLLIWRMALTMQREKQIAGHGRRAFLPRSIPVGMCYTIAGWRRRSSTLATGDCAEYAGALLSAGSDQRRWNFRSIGNGMTASDPRLPF